MCYQHSSLTKSKTTLYQLLERKLSLSKPKPGQIAMCTKEARRNSKIWSSGNQRQGQNLSPSRARLNTLETQICFTAPQQPTPHSSSRLIKHCRHGCLQSSLTATRAKITVQPLPKELRQIKISPIDSYCSSNYP